MTPQHARDLLHRLDAGAHDSDTPFVEARAGPVDRAVPPERLEALAQEHGPHGPQLCRTSSRRRMRCSRVRFTGRFRRSQRSWSGAAARPCGGARGPRHGAPDRSRCS